MPMCDVIKPGCGCFRCLTLYYHQQYGPMPSLLHPEHPINRMILCPSCGNKRCPHATHHIHDCTGSNEPGQTGSRYLNTFTGKEGKSHDSE